MIGGITINKEEILNASISENKGMDERQHNNYKIAYMTGGLAAILMTSVFQIYECITMGNWWGYMSICMAQLGIAGVVYGIKERKSALGKLYLISGSMCTFVSIVSAVTFFVKEII
jgi:hypothetical protein